MCEQVLHDDGTPVMDRVRRGRGGRGEDPPPGKFAQAAMSPTTGACSWDDPSQCPVHGKRRS